MAKYLLNPAGVDKARELIDAHHYVLHSRWGDVQPDATAENAFLERHDWAACTSG